MIIGGHSIIYTTDPDADRAFFRDVLRLPNVDAGEGWLIFGLPPAEVAMHPANENDVHEFYLLCDDVEALVGEMEGRGVACAPVQSLPWGLLTQITLPGGGRLGIYEPRHARPHGAQATAARRGRSATKRTRKVAKKATKRPARKAARKKAPRRR